MDTKYIANALGRRKCAVARVYVSEGSGKITINKRDLVDYFPSTGPASTSGRPFRSVLRTRITLLRRSGFPSRIAISTGRQCNPA